jgi:hypothetical protein
LTFAGLPDYTLGMSQNGNIRQKGSESGKTDPATKKSFEISYAIFRITGKIENKSFGRMLERQALKLLDAASAGNGNEAIGIAEQIKQFINFGEALGFVHPGNAQTLRNELGSLDELVGSSGIATSQEEIPLGDIFLKQETLFMGRPANPANGKSGNGNQSGNPAIRQNKSLPEYEPAIQSGNPATNANESGNSIPSAIRQSAILDRIRQSGNCRLKDIMEVLPDTSERTLRYDLQSLVEQNLVERVGTGGPMVFYRVK